MTAPLISAQDLTKIYRVYARPWDRLVEAVIRRPRHRPFVALSEVSFELSRGESLGIIGENGAGKSTLLKILAGIVQPTRGQLAVGGKVASILELGSGFHPEMTGRQNIVLNGAMLGLSAAELKERLPAILDFSELGEFIDQPVKCYSTGMTMRLGFSIATQVDPDILIIDEALSVGDGYFQKKCMDRLLELVAAGKTLLFCSHAMYYVSAFCQRALWLRRGEAAALGSATEVVREYENFLHAKSGAAAEASLEAAPATGPSHLPARLTSVHLPRGRVYRHRDPLVLEIEWETTEPSRRFHLGVGVNRLDEIEVLAFGTHLDGLPPVGGLRHHRAQLVVPELPILKGAFTLYVFLLDEQGLHVYDRQILPGAIEITADGYRLGLFAAEHRWTLDGTTALSSLGNTAAAG